MRISFFVCLLMMPLSSVGANDVEIIAHRGASHVAPENTISSIKLAWEQKADSVEIDVYLSKDGHIVLFHDKDTKRIGGRDQLVAEQTLAKLRELDMGAWKSAEFAGEKIPILPEVLPLIPEGKKLYIEIKTESEILPQLKKDIDASGIDHERLVIICFDHPTIANAKKLFPEIPCYWLSTTKPNRRTGKPAPSVEELIEKAKSAGVEGLDLQSDPIIDAAYVQKIKDANLGIYVWTVNEVEEARRLMEAGVEGITTDRPAFLREQLDIP